MVNVTNRLYLPVLDQNVFASRTIVKIRNDLSQMNIQYTSTTTNGYLAVYFCSQVKDGSNLRIITVEVNGERN